MNLIRNLVQDNFTAFPVCADRKPKVSLGDTNVLWFMQSKLPAAGGRSHSDCVVLCSSPVTDCKKTRLEENQQQNKREERRKKQKGVEVIHVSSTSSTENQCAQQ